MEFVDYKQNILKIYNSKELFDKGIFYLPEPVNQIFPIEIILQNEFKANKCKRLALHDGCLIGYFSVREEIKRALYKGLLSDIYLEVNKNKGVHIHKNNLCPERCDFQKLLKNSFPLVNIWLSDFSSSTEEQASKPAFCINCLTPYSSTKNIPSDFLCSSPYKGRNSDYVCRQVYNQEFKDKILPISKKLFTRLSYLLVSNGLEDELIGLKKDIKFISKRIAKRIIFLKDSIINHKLVFTDDIKTVEVKMNPKTKKVIEKLIAKDMIDTDMINEAIEAYKLSPSQSNRFKEEIFKQFKPVINIVHKNKDEFYKEIPPEYAQAITKRLAQSNN